MEPEIYTEITPLVQNVSYPASREEILDHIRMYGAREEVVDIISRIPPRLYGSNQEVLTTLDTTLTYA